MKHSKPAIVVMAIVLAALLFTASGCELDGEAKEYRDPSKLIEVEKGEEFAIVLESNPTTGYQWKLAEELDAEVITLVKTEYKEPDEELLGASGEEKWTFKAEGLGETSITLAYVRPWEEEGEPAAVNGSEAEEGPVTVTFNVRVRKKGSMDKEPKKYEDPEETIEVEAGYEFAIVLESNPTTGYTWQLAEPLDEKVVELVKTGFEKKGAKEEGAEGEGEVVGAPGEEVWTFQAVSEGETEIKLEYVRSWETDKAPEETKTFKVVVKHSEEKE